MLISGWIPDSRQGGQPGQHQLRGVRQDGAGPVEREDHLNTLSEKNNDSLKIIYSLIWSKITALWTVQAFVY